MGKVRKPYDFFMLRQSVYITLAGYADVNDAERLSPGPTSRLIGSENIWKRGAADCFIQCW